MRSKAGKRRQLIDSSHSTSGASGLCCTPRRVSSPTHAFVQKWFELVRAGEGRSFAVDKEALELVRRREIRVKGAQRSRIANPFRVGWNGASGSDRLDFRWRSSVQRMVLDVAQGRARA
jgi:hypothetical protein